jgi:hypothetical protein
LAPEDLAEILAGDALAVATFVGMPSEASCPELRGGGVSNAVLDAVRKVALVGADGDADAARVLSKREWDAARERAGYPDLSTAERFRQRLKLRHWHTVLAVAFLPPKQRAGALGGYNKRVSALSQGADLPVLRAAPAERELIERFRVEDDVLADAGEPAGADGDVYRVARGVTLASAEVLTVIVARALRTVAFRLGHSPSAVAYDDVIRDLELERERSGLPPLGFPGSQVIIDRIGSWQKALTDAGLEAPPAHTRPKGLLTVDVLDECIDRVGVVPGFDYFRAWCRECDLSVQHRRTDSWDVVVEETRAKRAARGDQTPEGIVRRRKHWPPLPTAEEAAEVKAKLGGPRRYQRRRSEEDAREGIRIYGREHLAPGERPSQRDYMAACKRDPRLVWPSKLRGITGKTLVELCVEEGL